MVSILDEGMNQNRGMMGEYSCLSPDPDIEVQSNRYICVTISLAFIAIISFITSYILITLTDLIFSGGLNEGVVTILSTIISLFYFLHISD